MPVGVLQILDGVADRLHFFETAKPGSLQIARGESRLFPSSRSTSPRCPCRESLEQHRSHGKREGRVENTSERTQAAAPGRIEDLLVAIPVIENLFAQEEI